MALMTTCILLSLAALAGLILLLRHTKQTLGMPIAYLALLMLNHVPGAYVYVVTNGSSSTPATERGFVLATIGALCYFAGVAVVVLTSKLHIRIWRPRVRGSGRPASTPQTSTPQAAAARPPAENGQMFWLFCLIGGWTMVYAISALLRLPSIGAVIEKAGSVWMLGVLLGLATALRRQDLRQGLVWMSALAIYPVLMLLFGGFMSYGAATVVIAMGILAVVARSYWKVLATIAVCTVFALTVFVNYFAARTTFRDAVWGGASIDRRLDLVFETAAQSHIFSTNNPKDVEAVNLRLNQNYFVGMAANRLRDGYVDYLKGQSIVDGAIALVPRILWPTKPVYGGSPEVVRKMTGLNLSTNTSWGVGQVMEFYINFAMPGLVIGFLVLGGLTAWLDRRAAHALRTNGDGLVFLYFLPCAALLEPISSVVELSGGTAAALGAGFIWKFAWMAFKSRSMQQRRYAQLTARYR